MTTDMNHPTEVGGGLTMTEKEGRCPSCRHLWGDHPEDGEGCQAHVMIAGSGPYDCNCQKTPPASER
jgi:hypothetical protein